MALHLKIVTPARVLIDAEVSELAAPGMVGEFGVLPEHVTFLGGLDVGVLTYVEGEAKRRVVILGGYAEVEEDVVTVLADDAELADDIDPEEARAALVAAEQALDGGADTPEGVDELLGAVRRAQARVDAAS
jgi:F-type H+-transporting ATPase subunit epsilon